MTKRHRALEEEEEEAAETFKEVKDTGMWTTSLQAVGTSAPYVAACLPSGLPHTGRPLRVLAWTEYCTIHSLLIFPAVAVVLLLTASEARTIGMTSATTFSDHTRKMLNKRLMKFSRWGPRFIVSCSANFHIFSNQIKFCSFCNKANKT